MANKQEWETVSRECLRRNDITAGIMVGGGLFLGYVLVVVARLYLSDFERIGKPLLGGIVVLIVSLGIVYGCSRLPNGKEAKIPVVSPKRKFWTDVIVSTLALIGAGFLAWFYYLIWGLYGAFVPFVVVIGIRLLVDFLHKWAEAAK